MNGENLHRGVKVALVSLGCPKNLVDAEVMLGLLEQAGFAVIEDPAEAAVIIVNTCAFIQPAETEALDALLELADFKHEGHCRALLCTGCLTQRRGADLLELLPEVDGFLGVGAIERIGEVITRALAGERPFVTGDNPVPEAAFMRRWRSSPPWLYYLRIADGCNHRCSFCTIPAIRGPMRSRPLADVVREFTGAVADGTVAEVCLIAQDTSAYGRDLPGTPSLSDLLYALGEISYEGWIRLLYLHPAHVDRRLFAAMAEVPCVVPYVDIPLQHASAKVLRRMGRSGGKQEYLELVANIRQWLPHAAIRSTFITGFPGETEEDFNELAEFLQEARLDRVSAFRYWPEEGTRAAALTPQVPEDSANERLETLLELQEGISYDISRTFIGKNLQILIEEKKEGGGVGRSYRDAPEVDGEVHCTVVPNKAPAIETGRFAAVRITHAQVHDLRGEVIGDS